MTDAIIFDRGHLEAVLAEFVEDNPLACEGILSVARLEYTTSVPTLAVTLQEDPPRLLINQEFVASHIQTEHDLRAVLLHEFLHVLLGHTQLFRKNDPAKNISADPLFSFTSNAVGVHGLPRARSCSSGRAVSVSPPG